MDNLYKHLETFLPNNLVNNIFVEVDLGYLSAESKGKLLDKFLEILDRRVSQRTWHLLKPGKREIILQKFNLDPKEGYKALQTHIPNLQEIYKEESLKLRSEFISRMKEQV